MKILRLSFIGLPLFTENIDVDFLALQRVGPDNAVEMFNIHDNLYQNNVISISGINASGKTLLLKAISLSFDIISNNPINSSPGATILKGLTPGATAVFKIYFQHGEKIYFLKSVIGLDEAGGLHFDSERLFSKNLKAKTAKKYLYDDLTYSEETVRDDGMMFLPDDVSMIIAFNKKNSSRISHINAMDFTNSNRIDESFSSFLPEVVSFLDPGIESFDVTETNGVNTKKGYEIKFRGSDRKIVCSSEELSLYLSSGTIKGINIFSYAISIFKKGGYIVIDELENHFNKEIASTLVRLFMNKTVNPNGGVLVFSTHYPEILDEFSRNDNVIIVWKDNLINVRNLSLMAERNDIKKSDMYQSGCIGGTIPDYNSYNALRKKIVSFVVKGE